MKTAFLCLLLFVSSLSTQAQSSNYSEYLGRYTDGLDYVVYFERTPYGLTIRPALWTATQLLRKETKDDFVVVDRTERRATFQRDSRGVVTGVTIKGMEGEGLRLVRTSKSKLPIELLLAGSGRLAGRTYLAQVASDPRRMLDAAARVLNRFPTKSKSVIDLLVTARSRFADNSRLHTLLGFAFVAAGDRSSAIDSFRRAYAIDPTNKESESALARLEALPGEKTKDSSWKLPFPLEAVFKLPTTEEIKAVEHDWALRDLKVSSVEDVATGRIKFDDDEFDVQIISHSVHGKKHYGAILTPTDVAYSTYPVIVEAKGVSWNYFTLNLQRLDAPNFMSRDRRRFIYVVPSFRGEVMRFNGVDYRSEGDRTDAWDGATDDAIAFLSVALQKTPTADASRICVFGRSRGGTVALLMGGRDARVRCVVQWSGPTDWFELMGTDGWTQPELFSEGLRTRAKPDETGGQLVEHFLSKAVAGEEKLEATRHRMIAASPLYFASRLPRLQMHYGVEDTSVPVRNGLVFANRLNLPVSSRLGVEQSIKSIRAEAFFYPRQGHDTDRLLAPRRSAMFLRKLLLNQN